MKQADGIIASQGIQVEISPYFAEPTMEELTPQIVKRGLTTEFMGQEIVSHQSIGSTNEVAKELAKQGASQGTLVIAEEQTAGKGRLGRSWLAPQGSSLLLSIILYPSLTASQAPRLTMASSLAVAYAIEEISSLPVCFKWPNDILLREKKAGGILTEISISGRIVDYAVVGIGLNVNLDVRAIPEIADTATSLSMELGREVSRLRLLQALLKSMEREYHLLERGESPRERWAARLSRLGQEVEVTTPSGQESGWAEGVDAEGALILRREDGTKAYITVGDLG
jgi:BirA family biotin operon repressor/biotin-[acetyl-CoA-carboxylase] ligase